MRYSFILIATLLLTGCEVGPNYKGPPSFASDPTPNGRFVRASDQAMEQTPSLSRWWESLDDQILTTLEADALDHSPTLDLASARIAQAQARLTQKRAGQLPSVGSNATYLKARIPGINVDSANSAESASGQAPATDLNFYNLGLNASWELDLFGGGRRGAEQARAIFGARHADLADAQVSLTAQIADAYVNLREVQTRIKLAAQLLQIQEQQLALTQIRLRGGTVSQLDVERLRSRLQNTQADGIPLNAERDQYLDQLAVLTGRPPGALDGVLTPEGAIPLPPSKVPVGDPATLIAHRPDVRSAERELAAATAAIGVSRAKQFPTLKFTGVLGLGGTDPDDVLDFGKLTALLAPSLSWSFLDFGKARAETRESEAQRDQAVARYRQSVLGALQDAETSLSQFGGARAHLAQLYLAEATTVRASRRNAIRVAAGTSRKVEQLDVESRALDAAVAVARARARLTNSYIAVQKAVGLGWSDTGNGSQLASRK